MTSHLKNPILKGAEESVEAGLTPKNRDNYLKALNWGTTVGLQDGTKGAFASLKRSKDPVSDSALAAVNVMQILRMESQGTLPPQAMAPAAYVLMLQALDFAESVGVLKVDMEALTRATHIYTNHIFKVSNLSPQMLINAGKQVHGVLESPAKLELVQRYAGTVRDPRASTPVEMPPPAPRNRAERRRQGRR